MLRRVEVAIPPPIGPLEGEASGGAGIAAYRGLSSVAFYNSVWGGGNGVVYLSTDSISARSFVV
jgi:hypothetical protein